MEYRLSNQEIVDLFFLERYHVMVTLAEAMGYKEWVDADGNVWPAEALWGEHSPETAAEVVRDEMNKLRSQLGTQ